ncbi:MAG: hypothetical protein A3C38_00460 [Planctomycetes bacterium RIFCSPHIGHO2_02_FULL_50_42]|nr:MAG: hypothetical protein A3C38_00460 [Planctomycetes bacterium RIFCSPHIGHO2_02_FULL_50_42]OHB95621.1 MAG: hypothetical protein A3I59_09585 [Planctomycetes bacterium RIFCSPLOWO2_02_FULL_50_16]
MSLTLGVSYFGSKHLDHVRRDMDKIAEAGCNMVVLTMSEEDMTYYPDTMVKLVKAAKEAGLRVFLDPWGVGRVFGGEAFSNFVSMNPRERQRMELPEGELWADKACLNSATFRKMMEAWVDLAGHTNAHGVFWDEPHLYYGELKPLFGKKRDVWGCSCNVCKRLFREKFGYEMMGQFSDDISKFRQATILGFIESLCELAVSKGLINALCVFPMHDPRFGIYQWEKIMENKYLSVFGSDPYWLAFEKDMEEFVRSVARDVVALCKKYDKEPQIWIQGFRVPSGREDEVKRAIDIAREEGVNNIAVWSYGGSECMSYLQSERPEEVWKRVSEAFNGLRDR